MSRILRSGETIAAIERYREATGLGLKGAKIAIDRLRAQIDGR